MAAQRASPRRSFLATLALGALAPALALFARAPRPAPGAGERVAVAPSAPGYRLTAHIRRFYERANL